MRLWKHKDVGQQLLFTYFGSDDERQWEKQEGSEDDEKKTSVDQECFDDLHGSGLQALLFCGNHKPKGKREIEP